MEFHDPSLPSVAHMVLIILKDVFSSFSYQIIEFVITCS